MKYWLKCVVMCLVTRGFIRTEVCCNVSRGMGFHSNGSLSTLVITKIIQVKRKSKSSSGHGKVNCELLLCAQYVTEAVIEILSETK